MTTPQTILRDSLITLPVLVVVGFALGGALAAVVVALAGLVSVVGFGAAAWALSHVLTGDRSGLAAGVILLKGTGGLLALCGLMLAFDPMWVLLGAHTVLIGIVTRGAAEALHGQPALAEES